MQPYPSEFHQHGMDNDADREGNGTDNASRHHEKPEYLTGPEGKPQDQGQQTHGCCGHKPHKRGPSPEDPCRWRAGCAFTCLSVAQWHWVGRTCGGTASDYSEFCSDAQGWPTVSSIASFISPSSSLKMAPPKASFTVENRPCPYPEFASRCYRLTPAAPDAPESIRYGACGCGVCFNKVETTHLASCLTALVG